MKKKHTSPPTPRHLLPLLRHPLLSHSQERRLFRQLSYLRYCGRGQKSRAIAIRNTIVSHNLRLVVNIAGRANIPEESLDELVSHGCLALIRAVESFDWTRGFRFSTYATGVIKHELFKHRRWRRRKCRAPGFFNTQPIEGVDVPVCVDDGDWDIIDKKEVLAKIRRSFECLTERERQAFEAVFTRGLAPVEASREMGVTRERVRQLLESGKDRIRSHINETRNDRCRV